MAEGVALVEVEEVLVVEVLELVVLELEVVGAAEVVVVLDVLGSDEVVVVDVLDSDEVVVLDVLEVDVSMVLDVLELPSDVVVVVAGATDVAEDEVVEVMDEEELEDGMDRHVPLASLAGFKE